MSKNNSITYRQVGDYMIPNLVLSLEEACIKLSKWGMLHKDYLINNKKVEFTILLAEGTLWQHLANIDIHAQQMFNTLVEQMKQQENITEELKKEDQMKWVSCVQNIETRAVEIICKELIYV